MMTVKRQYPAASPTSRLVKTIKKTATAVAINHHRRGVGTEESKRCAWELFIGAGAVIVFEKSDLALLKF